MRRQRSISQLHVFDTLPRHNIKAADFLIVVILIKDEVVLLYHVVHMVMTVLHRCGSDVAWGILYHRLWSLKRSPQKHQHQELRRRIHQASEEEGVQQTDGQHEVLRRSRDRWLGSRLIG